MVGPEPALKHSNRSNIAQDPYLQDFAILGEQVFYFEPQHPRSPTDSDDVPPPDLVIICSWLYALPKHISKYTNAYQRLYPTTPILLLKQDGPDLMWRPNAWQMKNLKPATELIKVAESGLDRHLRVMMHVFSNGGSFTACQLADAYALSARSESNEGGWLAGPVTLLPVTALVIDSAPSIPDMRRGFIAFSQGMPSSLPGPVRAVGGAVLFSFMVSVSMASRLVGVEGVITSMRRKLNHGAFMAGGVRRVYIYSESDQLVPWQHVEMHAEEARNVLDKRAGGSGEERVKLEKFVGSRHVSHIMIDAERYWRIVKTLWADALLQGQA